MIETRAAQHFDRILYTEVGGVEFARLDIKDRQIAAYEPDREIFKTTKQVN